MTQRSILAGETPTVIVRASGQVRVEGWASDRVEAKSEGRWGLKLEKRSETEVARVRAKVGDWVVLDWHVDPLGALRKGDQREAIEVQLGSSGEVRVPYASRLKVYAGKSIEVRGLRGSLAAYASGDLLARDVNELVQASAGGALDIQCESVSGGDLKLTAGRDLRCYIRGLTDARLMVDDLGGDWEGVIGVGGTQVRLRAGGDVTVVTDQVVVPQGPLYVLGRVERPAKPEAGSGGR